jgi:hypothetical protein
MTTMTTMTTMTRKADTANKSTPDSGYRDKERGKQGKGRGKKEGKEKLTCQIGRSIFHQL